MRPRRHRLPRGYLRLEHEAGLGGQLESRPPATGQRGERLAEGQIAKSPAGHGSLDQRALARAPHPGHANQRAQPDIHAAKPFIRHPDSSVTGSSGKQQTAQAACGIVVI
jgi:hypothetical protein